MRHAYFTGKDQPYEKLKRALRAVEPQQALRIPSATWFRYRRAAEEGDAILLLLTREPCARSSAACVLECSPGEPPKI